MVSRAYARAALGAFLRAAQEMRDHGTFTFTEETLYMSEITGIFEYTDEFGA